MLKTGFGNADLFFKVANAFGQTFLDCFNLVDLASQQIRAMLQTFKLGSYPTGRQELEQGFECYQLAAASG